MSERNSFKQAKTKKGKRILAQRAPKTVENHKKQLVLRGTKASKLVLNVLQEFHWLRSLHSAKMFAKKEAKRPFEDHTNLELLGSKRDASLFVYGSHSKKRPHNFILGRLFDYQLLDMVELAVDEKTYKSSVEMKGGFTEGSKPALIFQGEPFDNDPDFRTMKNLFLDYLRGVERPIENITHLERVIVLTATSKKQILFRQYKLLKKRSGQKVPRVDLREIGPHIDFTFRRREQASMEIVVVSKQHPKVQNKVKKNVGQDGLGQRTGTIHMHRQNLKNIEKLKLKKPKALRTRGKKRKNTEQDDTEPKKKQKK